MKQALKYYLAAYNLVAFCAWLMYLCYYVAVAANGQGVQALMLLNIAQGLAVLEILHAAVKWVRSPMGTTLAQVSSRIMVLVVLNVIFMPGNFNALPDGLQKWLNTGLLLISVAWTTTELIRYSFYFLNLFGAQPSVLLWMRYSFFIVLYPLGVTGEWLILTTPVLHTHFAFNAYMAFAIVLAVVYIYYFPILYGYMWKQRREKVSR